MQPRQQCPVPDLGENALLGALLFIKPEWFEGPTRHDPAQDSFGNLSITEQTLYAIKPFGWLWLWASAVQFLLEVRGFRKFTMFYMRMKRRFWFSTWVCDFPCKAWQQTVEGGADEVQRCRTTGNSPLKILEMVWLIFLANSMNNTWIFVGFFLMTVAVPFFKLELILPIKGKKNKKTTWI